VPDIISHTLTALIVSILLGMADKCEKLASEYSGNSFCSYIANEFRFLTITKYPRTKSDYAEFSCSTQSPVAQFLVNMLLLFYSGILVLRVSFAVQRTEKPFPSLDSTGLCLVLALCFIFTICVHVTGWLLFTSLCEKFPTDRSRQFIKSHRLLIQRIFHFSFTISCSMIFIGRTVAGECPVGSAPVVLGFCIPTAETHGMPQDTVIMMLTSIYISVAVLRETSPSIVFLNWLITVVTLSFNALYMSSGISALYTTIYACASFLIIISMMHRNFDVYITTRKLERALLENERMAAVELAHEMGSMIANVAQ
jgi:hypothetical protein